MGTGFYILYNLKNSNSMGSFEAKIQSNNFFASGIVWLKCKTWMLYCRSFLNSNIEADLGEL